MELIKVVSSSTAGHQHAAALAAKPRPYICKKAWRNSANLLGETIKTIHVSKDTAP